jgi:tetratricopeptide (TPR) repeat protein
MRFMVIEFRIASRATWVACALALGLMASVSQAQQTGPGSEPPKVPARPAEPQPFPRGQSKSDSKAPQSKPDAKSDQQGAATNPPGQAKQKGATKQVPTIAVIQPRTPAEREKALSDLYAHLATAEDEAAAKVVAGNIERLWLNSGSDTVALLMERAMQAAQQKKSPLALKLLDEVVAMAPDYAEAWNRRAYVNFTDNNVERALGDLRRVLALDPNHFKALDGLAHILKDIGQKKAALAAVKQLMDVHPFWDGAKAMHDELAREVEGQAL